MKISGFTIIKNAIINDYPIVEAIRSILPVVDEMIVLIGDSTDDTIGLIERMNEPKIRIHHSVWDPALRRGGAVLASETDKAFQLVDPSSDWAFYIQADEAVHEKYHAPILEACKKYKDDKRVEGLLFDYLHFYGTYDYIGDSRRWYNKEIRIIRNDKRISAYRDAQGFRAAGRKLDVKKANAYVYHYGWVKSQEQMIRKMKEVSQYWLGDQEEWQNFLKNDDFFKFEDYDALKLFQGTHPQVMLERIKHKNWSMDFDLKKKNLSLKNRVLYFIEKLTGVRLFTFKNYRII
jgi:hypothetical protein